MGSSFYRNLDNSLADSTNKQNNLTSSQFLPPRANCIWEEQGFQTANIIVEGSNEKQRKPIYTPLTAALNSRPHASPIPYSQPDYITV